MSAKKKLNFELTPDAVDVLSREIEAALHAAEPSAAVKAVQVHPGYDHLNRYLNGEDAPSIEAHLEICETCAAQAASLAEALSGSRTRETMISTRVMGLAEAVQFAEKFGMHAFKVVECGGPSQSVAVVGPALAGGVAKKKTKKAGKKSPVEAAAVIGIIGKVPTPPKQRRPKQLDAAPAPQQTPLQGSRVGYANRNRYKELMIRDRGTILGSFTEVTTITGTGIKPVEDEITVGTRGYVPDPDWIDPRQPGEAPVRRRRTRIEDE